MISEIRIAKDLCGVVVLLAEACDAEFSCNLRTYVVAVIPLMY